MYTRQRSKKGKEKTQKKTQLLASTTDYTEPQIYSIHLPKKNITGGFTTIYSNYTKHWL